MIRNNSENNKVLRCIDCGNEFIFTEGEQDYYQKHKLVEPKRCKECRRAKRHSMEGR